MKIFAMRIFISIIMKLCYCGQILFLLFSIKDFFFKASDFYNFSLCGSFVRKIAFFICKGTVQSWLIVDPDRVNMFKPLLYITTLTLQIYKGSKHPPAWYQ